MKSTEEILHNIRSATEFKPRERRSDTEISVFLKEALSSINLKQMFTAIDIDPTNGYKYINGQRTINRDQLIKILIYLGYDFESQQQVFKQYGFPLLYAKNERDAALIFCIYNQFSYIEVKRYLSQNKLLGL